MNIFQLVFKLTDIYAAVEKAATSKHEVITLRRHLYYCVTSLVFLCDSMSYNYKKYIDFKTLGVTLLSSHEKLLGSIFGSKDNFFTYPIHYVTEVMLLFYAKLMILGTC